MTFREHMSRVPSTPRDVLGWIAAVAIGAALIACVASTCRGQTWRDRDSIAAALGRVDTGAVRLSLPAALAIAWEETAGNDSTPGVRGHHCWYTVPAHWDTWSRNDSTRVLRHVHHEKDCEVGRFQIKPSTARLRCAGWNVFTYGGNLACFAQMFAEDTRRGGTLYAIRRQNGSGPKADAYVNRVLRTIGWLTLQS